MNKNLEALLQDFQKVGQKYAVSPKDPRNSTEWLDKLNSQVITRMLATYSVQALEEMATRRGINSQGRKKAWLAQELALRFYNENAIEKSLKQLSPLAREGFLRMKQNGGVINLALWQNQMEAKHGKAATTNVLSELVGNMLAFFGQFYSLEHIEFNTTSVHELTKPTFGWGNIVLWTFPKAIRLQMLTDDGAVSVSSNDLLAPYKSEGESPKVASEANFEGVLTDIFAFIRYLEQNKVKVLQSGDPGKRDYLKLNDLMLVKENPKQLTESRKMSDLGRVNFVWRLLVETQLVQLANYTEVTLNPETNTEFYSLPRYQQARLLTAAWLRSSFEEFVRIPTLEFNDRNSTDYNSLPDHASLVRARIFLLKTLEDFQRSGSLPTQQWLDFTALLLFMQEKNNDFLLTPSTTQNYYYSYNPGYYGQSYYNGFTSRLKKAEKGTRGMGNAVALKRDSDWELVEGEYIAEVFREPLAWLGLIELGYNREGRPAAFRLTELGKAVLTNQPTEAEARTAEQTRQLAAVSPDMTKALLVQPNFDVMILAPLQHQALLRQLDRFANQSSLGDVAMYRMTKESVLRGLRAGLSGTELLQILNDNSRVPVASNISTTIQDWAAEFERLLIYDYANLLETPTAEILDRLLSRPEAVISTIERLGPTFALVKGDLDHLDGILRQIQKEMGVAPTSRNKEAMPLYLDYSRGVAGAIEVAGDRTIKVNPHLGNPYLNYLLGRFAELISWNAATMSGEYRLSAQAGQRAQLAGLTYEEVSTTLREWLKPENSRGFFRLPELPPEMDLALKGWLGYYSPMLAEKALALQVTQNEQIEELFGIKEFAPALIGKAGPHTVLVRESHFAALREKLAEWGMPVIAPDIDPPALLPEPEVALVEEPETPKTGKRGKPKGPPKPKELKATRERKRREENEKNPATNPLFEGGLGGGPIQVMDLLDILSRGPAAGILKELGDDGFFDDEDDGPPSPRGRGRRR